MIKLVRQAKLSLQLLNFPCALLKEDPCNNQQDINNPKDYSAKPTFLCILNPNFQFKEQDKRQDDHSSQLATHIYEIIVS